MPNMPVRRFLAALVGIGAMICFAGELMAQEAGQGIRGAARACQADMRRLCGDVRPGGGRIIACLRDKEEQLSPGCQSVVASVAKDGAAGQGLGKGSAAAQAGLPGLPEGMSVMRDIAYGKAPQQRLDVYSPAKAQNAPVIVMLHGGAWAFGSKDARGVVENKVAHYLPKGYVFVSVETRLVPDADPLQQTDDLAAALAHVQKNAASWGGDASKLVLIGHSAGAHLVALLSADPSIAAKAGAKPWMATIALDSAAYDIGEIMKARHPKFYDKAFGADPAFWAKVSPSVEIAKASGKSPAGHILLVCSSLRSNSCPQAETFAAKAGGRAKVLPVALRHMPINATLGGDNQYTKDVDAFLATLGLK